jgi:putative membrane protein insertion efficiency factor
MALQKYSQAPCGTRAGVQVPQVLSVEFEDMSHAAPAETQVKAGDQAAANCTGCVRNAPRMLGRALIGAYRYTFSPLIGFHCRHLPTCSEYGDEALSRFGLWAGGWMTLGRLCRCHPFGTSGLDFVPAEKPKGARWFLPWRYARWRGPNETPPA